LIAGVAEIAGNGFAALASRLRPRWLAYREQVCHGWVVDLAPAMAYGGEIDQLRSDGSRLDLSVRSGPREARGEHG
jgi:hypothetical protein